MDESVDSTGGIHAVTIARAYGSGGGEIAARLAARLGWLLVDHALVVRVAREIGTNLEDAEMHDEHIQGTILAALAAIGPLFPDPTGTVPPATLLSDELYRATFDRLVRAAAARGRVVIVGRASEVILGGQPDILHVRVVAPFAQRVAYVMRREGMNRHAAEARIHRKDRDRATYLQREYHHRPDEIEMYDLMLNTGRLSLDGAVAVIREAMRALSDGMREGAPGRIVGLARYPTAPGDIPTLHPDSRDAAGIPR